MSTPTYSLKDLLTLMARLREPDYGCPWDLAQSYKTIVASTIEEVYEVVDAIEQNDPKQLKEELGDLLFQIIFYSHLGKEDGQFDFHDVVSGITEKLLRRHPHVFPEGTLASRINLNAGHDASTDKQQAKVQANIKKAWDKIKEEERQSKGHNSLLDDIPLALPSTVRAVKLQKRAASATFDWSSLQKVYDKLQEEIVELQEASSQEDPKEAMEEELGDVLFTVINLSRHLKIDPETALRRANTKFESRFRYVETLAKQQSKALDDQSEEVLEEWWQLAKKACSKA